MTTKLHVGASVWVFNFNRGRTHREHWQRFEVTGETSRSWLYGPEWDQSKIPKNKPLSRMIVTSEEEMEQRVWVHENQHKISSEIFRCSDYETLKKIATLLNYSPTA